MKFELDEKEIPVGESSETVRQSHEKIHEYLQEFMENTNTALRTIDDSLGGLTGSLELLLKKTKELQEEITKLEEVIETIKD